MLSRCVTVATFAGVLIFTTGAAADVASEIATAADHAGYATTSLNLGAIREHLHHAVNCLVGPSGKQFDSGVENPCAKMGRGAIVDATDAEIRTKLEAAVVVAQTGIDANDEATARSIAVKTYSTLKGIK